MALALHLKKMTKDGLVILNRELGCMDYNKNMTKLELCVIIVDRITAPPPPTTRTHEHKHPNTNTPIGSTC